MHKRSSATGSIFRSSLTMMTIAFATVAAIGFVLAVPGDVPDSEGTVSGTCGDNLFWTLDSEGVLSITGSGPMEDTYLIDPERWGGEVKTIIIGDGVTSIGDCAFSDCSSLIAVDLGDSVTSIGMDAFCGCSSLTSIIIPDSVTEIGQWAFQNCRSLTSIAIPGSVTSIGDAPFAGCRSLTGIDVDGTNVAYCSVDGILFDEKKSTLIQYPPGRIEPTYSVPDSVGIIGNGAFLFCAHLNSVSVPDSVGSIGIAAFAGSDSLVRIDVEVANAHYSSVDGILFDKGMTKLVQYPAGKTDIAYAIPDTVTEIGDYSFYYCTHLISVTIPDSVGYIGFQAFVACTSLASIAIPDSTYIWTLAFCHCDSLLEIELGYDISMYLSYPFSSHTFYAEDGTTVLDQNEKSDFEGYTFKGESIDRMVRVSALPKASHSVTYDTGGGSASAPIQEDVQEGREFTLATYSGTKTGCVFAGWSCDGKEYSAGQTVTMSTEDMEFVAIWVIRKDVTSISLSETEIVLVRGEARMLTATVYPTDATVKDVIWTSSDESVASVDESGNVTALKLGRTTITAASADGGISASCTVSVEEREILVAIKSAGDGNVYVMISSLDGGHIPVGKITMELNYSVYSATLEDWVDRSDSTKDDPVLVETEGSFAVLLVDLSDAEHPADYTSAVAMFTVGEGEDQTVYVSDITAYNGKSS